MSSPHHHSSKKKSKLTLTESKENLLLAESGDQDVEIALSHRRALSFRETNDTLIKCLQIEDVVIVATLACKNADDQSDKILQTFNAGIKESCFVYKAFPGRALPRVPANCFLIGHRNQIAELADPKGERIALSFNTDPTTIIKVIGIVEKTKPFYGEYGKFVLNVPAGYYAKGWSKTQPLLYGEGPHVILDPTFTFEKDGFVSQIEPYIQHSTIHILRVPGGKVAKAWMGTEARILESQREPYVFNDPQFRLVIDENKGKDNKSSFFSSASERYIEHGSIKRIIPHTGEVCITYNNGILFIIPPPTDGKPVIIDSPVHNVDGFINTALQTYLFPSEETKSQAAKDDPRSSADERNLKVFQTRDSLRIGVVLVVAFQIRDPEIAITKLGKDGILPHIENIAFADMGRAIQLSTLQEVMHSSSHHKKNTSNQEDDEHTITAIQDHVRQSLVHDLADYGIELVRMNIETLKVLDEEIAKKLAGHSVISAEFTTKQATLVKEYDIKTTEARLRADTDNIQLQQKNQAIVAQAQAKLDSAQREAEALLIGAEARRKAEEMRGQLFTTYPQLFELEMAKIKADALKNATIYVSPQEMANFFNSPFSVFTNVNPVKPGLR
jgi:regulator of protease activity HflC (stomatin/prohibitin superfamily)